MTKTTRDAPVIECIQTSMYTHPFLPQPGDEALRRFVIENPFCQMITASVQGGLHCSALVLIPDKMADAFTLLGHLAKRNPHADALVHADSALVLFPGPHGYVSPSRYEDKPDVPTWNYVAVQARGELEVIDDVGAIEVLLRDTVDYMERAQATPWTLDQVPAERVSTLLNGVLGFRIVVKKLEGAFKLSQNKSDADKKRVADHFLSSNCLADVEIGRLMLKEIES